MLLSTLEAVFIILSQRHTEHPTAYSWCYYRASHWHGQAALLSDRRTTVQPTVSIFLFFGFIVHSFFFCKV